MCMSISFHDRAGSGTDASTDASTNTSADASTNASTDAGTDSNANSRSNSSGTFCIVCCSRIFHIVYMYYVVASA